MQKFERAKFEVKEYVESDHYGKFVVEPLERGFGTTLGNAPQTCFTLLFTGSCGLLD